MQKRIACLTLFIFLITAAVFAQMGGGKPSPAESATCDLGGGKTIKTDYSSPRAKGRKIFGELVPYGKVWRTGANEERERMHDEDGVGEHERFGGHYCEIGRHM